jgi:hypothetical protein
MTVYAYTRLWLADPTDANYPLAPTTVLFDFNVQTETGFRLEADPDFDSETFESMSLASEGWDGDQYASSRQRQRMLSWKNFFPHDADIDTVVARVRDLASAIDQSRVLVYQIAGSAEVEYWDIDPSTYPELLRGQERGLFRIARLLLDTGLPMRVAAYPHPRTAPVVSDWIAFSNGDRAMALNNPGNKRSEAKLEFVPDSGSLCAVRFGLRSLGNLTEYPDHLSAPLADATLGTDAAATVTADSSGVGGDAVLVDFSGQETMAKRVRVEETFTDPTSMEGTHMLYLRHKIVDNGDPSKFRARIRYGFITADMVMEATEVVDLDWQDIATPNFVEQEMGQITIPRGATGITYDVYAERRNGDSDLVLDIVPFDPADYYHSYVGVPGFRDGSWHQETYDADELDGTGKLKRGTYRLNELNEYAIVKSTVAGTGFAWPAGVHEVRADVTVLEPTDALLDEDDEPNPDITVVGELIVERDTGGGFVDWKSVKLRNRKNQTETRLDKGLRCSVSAADVTALYKYRIRVEQTAATLDGRAIRIHDATHRFTEAITTDLPAVLDSYERTAQAEDTGAIAFPLIQENGPLMLPPGDSVLVATMIDLPSDPGYDSIDELEPLGRVVLSRSGTFRYTVIPRWSH